MKARLIIDIDYIPNGTPDHVILSHLEALVKRALDEGLFTGVNGSEMDACTWEAKAINKKNKITRRIKGMWEMPDGNGRD